MKVLVIGHSYLDAVAKIPIKAMHDLMDWKEERQRMRYPFILLLEVS